MFALLLVGTAALFRERLAYTLNSEAHDLLEQEWVAMKGYLHIEKAPDTRACAAGACTVRVLQAVWEYDKNDPDEDFAVERLRRVYVLTDAKGTRDAGLHHLPVHRHRAAQGNRGGHPERPAGLEAHARARTASLI